MLVPPPETVGSASPLHQPFSEIDSFSPLRA